MISTGSSTKLSLSSSRSSFIGMTRDSSNKDFFRLETWKVLWTLLTSSGSSSLYATGPIRSSILKGPMLSPYIGITSLPVSGSLQALLNLHYLFSGFMDYFLSRELNISNFGPENSTNESECEMTVTIRDDGYRHSMSGDYFLDVQPCKGFHTICLLGRDEMCRFGKAIDNDPDCVMFV
ncbi:hypothetical protein Tco_0008889 [Tanacetum coccineum]